MTKDDAGAASAENAADKVKVCAAYADEVSWTMASVGSLSLGRVRRRRWFPIDIAASLQRLPKPSAFAREAEKMIIQRCSKKEQHNEVRH